MSERTKQQAGFTLVELMVSIVIASAVTWMLFSINNKMTRGMRDSRQVSELNANLRALKAEIADALSQAGFGMPTGHLLVPGSYAAVNGGLTILNAVRFYNGITTDGMDRVDIYYTNGQSVSRVFDLDASTNQITYDSSNGIVYEPGELLVLTGSQGNHACLIEVQSVSGDNLSLYDSDHCSGLESDAAGDGEVRLSRFIGRGYRISETNRGIGVLEYSATGGLVDNSDASDDWNPIATGVVNLQFAARYYEPDAIAGADFDGDGAPGLDWYNDDSLDSVSAATPRPQCEGCIPIEVSFSIDMKSRYPVPGSVAESTPAHQGPKIGDWPEVDLTLAPGSRPLGYRGEHIYRSVTSKVNLRYAPNAAGL